MRSDPKRQRIPNPAPAAASKRTQAQKTKGTKTAGPDPKPKGRTIGRVRLYDFNDLDRRCRAPAQIRAMTAAVIADLGGEANLSTLERVGVDHVAIMRVMVTDLSARWVAGEKVDIQAVATLINAFNRSAGALGWHRRTRDVTPNLDGFLDGEAVAEDDEDANAMEAAE